MPEQIGIRRVVLALAALILVTATLVYVAGESGLVGGEGSSPAPRPGEAFVAFQDSRGTSDEPNYSRVTLVGIEGTGGRKATALRCQRSHFVARRGLCLGSVTPSQVGGMVVGQSGYVATITGPGFRARRRLALPGLPLWARVSPDGRIGAASVEGEHESPTETILIDMNRGRIVSELGRFPVDWEGRRPLAGDVAISCLTFAGRAGRFYVSLGDEDRSYLAQGSLGSGRLRVIRENADCPSVSPDDRRLAYRKRVDGRWQLRILELSTGRETALREARPVDDQVEWLDGRQILYAIGSDLWVVATDGSASPRIFVAGARSPAVVRPGSGRARRGGSIDLPGAPTVPDSGHGHP
jgi:hypothetical protein